MTQGATTRRAIWLAMGLGLAVALTGCTGFWTPTAIPDSASGQRMTSMAKRHTWIVPGDFATIQEAIDSAGVVPGDRILVAAGAHAGANVTKSLEIRGEDGAVIESGPMHPAGLSMGFPLLAGSDGATIAHLTFETDLAIMNRAAVDAVTVEHCTFVNPIQAVSNWGGSNWSIQHNVIEGLRCRNGGGIGILIADRFGGVVTGNLVAHNMIDGTLTVPAGDGGGYNGSGIVIYADFRWGMAGATEISGNRVLHNRIRLVSDRPDLVDVAAFELTDTRNDPALDPVLFDNAIGFNDFRGTALQIDLTPEELELCNDISRNLGDNRGHGGHPSVFGPNAG